MTNGGVEAGRSTGGTETFRERRFSLQLEGLRVRVVLRGDCIERVSVERRGTGPDPRTACGEELVDYLRGRLRGDRPVRWDRLRLDDRTEFSRTVLEAVSEVPTGTTVSYGELARRIGKEGAARAVGQALGANPVPLVIPCHRVVRADGRPGGYAGRGTSSVKRHLLEREDRWASFD